MNDKKMSDMSTEAVLQLLVKRGLIEDRKIETDQLQLARRKKQQAAYHNTELLLKQYKNIVWMWSVFPIPLRKNSNALLKTLTI